VNLLTFLEDYIETKIIAVQEDKNGTDGILNNIWTSSEERETTECPNSNCSGKQ